MAFKPSIGGVCVLLSMILVGASATGDYYSSSGAGESSKSQPKIQYEKPVVQSTPKPEESQKQSLGKEPSYGAGEASKPQPKIQSGAYEKPVAQSKPKPEESQKPTLGKDPSYGAGEASKPQPKTQSGSYEKPVTPKPEESTKPTLEKTPDYNNEQGSKPQPKIKSGAYEKSVAQPMPKPEESQKPTLEKDSEPKAIYEPKFQHDDGPVGKPDFHFPNLHNGKPIKPIGDYYSKPAYKVNPHYKMPKLSIPKPEEAFPAAVEGIVICKSASGYVPVKGAVVRITCLEVNEEGYDTVPVSCQTNPTDVKGFFFKTLPSNKDVKKSWKNCKAFLEQSPMEDCGVPSNVNKGIDGYSLSSYHILQDKRIKLFTVGPFFYTPESKPTMNKAPTGGY